MRLQAKHAFGVITIGLALLPGAALTQTSGHGTERDTGYNPLGVRVGGFTLYPELELSSSFDDNLFAQSAGEIDDLLFEISPSLRLVSDWGRHSFDFTASGSIVTHSEQSSEDRSDWAVGAEGRFDIYSSLAFHMELAYSSVTEPRGDTNALAAATEPTTLRQYDAYAELRYRFNRFEIAAGGGLASFDYDDVPMIGGGTIDNDSRDRDVVSAQAEVNYDVSPGTRVFLRGTWNRQQYDQQPPMVVVSRDSEGYEIVGGFLFDLTNLISGEVSVGYFEQDYDMLSDADGFSYGASLDWQITQLTTISVSADRGVEETNLIGASGYINDSITLGLEHELRRNVIVGGNLSFTNNDYVGVAREEDIWLASLGAEFKFNRNASAEIGYAYEIRSSNVPGADYERNIVRVGLRFSF